MRKCYDWNKRGKDFGAKGNGKCCSRGILECIFTRCSDHYLVHQIRQCPAYIPQLNLVAVKNETIVGHVINIKSYISGDDGRNYEVISLGPISVLPQYQRTGVGSKLISEVKKIAKQSGYRAILLYGNPAFYLKQGFEPAEKYGIRNSENMFAAALHICGLSDGALDGINGKYYENEIYNVDDEAVKEFDKNFPPKKLISGTLSQQYFLEISAKCKPFKNN